MDPSMRKIRQLESSVVDSFNEAYCDLGISCQNISINLLLEKIKPGDIGLVAGPGLLSKLIRFGQKIEDGEASPFNHAFGFTTTKNQIFESSRHIQYAWFDKYLRKPVMIARHKGMTDLHYNKGIVEVEDNIGQIYPYPRIALHGIDLARAWLWRSVFRRKEPFRWSFGSVHGDWPVCSELVGQFIKYSDLDGGWEINGTRWRGLNPDHIFDAWRRKPGLWQVIFCGFVVM